MPVRYRGVDGAQFDLARVLVTANVSISATTSATGTVVASTGAFSVENEGTYEVLVYTPSLVKGTTNVDLELWQDGVPGTGTMVTTLSGHLAASATPFVSVVYISLSAGGHSLRAAGFVDAGTGTFSANVGTTGNFPNALLRVRPV